MPADRPLLRARTGSGWIAGAWRSPWVPCVRALLADALPSAIVPLTGQIRCRHHGPWTSRRWAA